MNTMLPLLLLFILITASSGSLLIKHKLENCTSLECIAFSNIFEHEFNRVIPCHDPNSVICEKDKFSFSESAGSKVHSTDFFDSLLKNTEDLEKLITPYLLGTSTSDKNVLESLKVEQQLFRDCINLGSNELEDKERKEKIQFWNNQFLPWLKIGNWRHIVERINNDFGFYSTLFDIKVSRNPMKPESNIITLQPPNIFPRIIKLKAFEKSNANDNEVLNPVNYLNITDSQRISIFIFSLRFFQLAYGAYSSKDEYPHAIMSINKWNETYNSNIISNQESVQLNWKKIINSSFEKAGITLSDNEPIFIKNKLYFINLANLLANTTNEIIAKSILLMWNTYFIYQNIISKSNSKSDRIKMCLFEIEHYAATYKLLRSFENDENYIDQRQILKNIVEVIKSEINKSKVSEIEKLYNTKRLNDFTSGLLKYNDEDFIANYYENYTLKRNYLDNLHQYREILLNKRLRMLRNNSDIIEPVNIFHQYEPQADIANMMLLDRNRTNKIVIYRYIETSKEVQYGTYGTAIATYLHSALNEAKIDKIGFYWPFIKYRVNSTLLHTNDVLKCFKFDSDNKQVILNNNNKTFRLPTPFSSTYIDLQDLATDVTEIFSAFGVSIAYKALQRHYNTDSKISSMSSVLKELNVTSQQLFFLAYIKSNCNYDSSKVLGLSKSEEFSQAFQCSDTQEMKNCNVTLFDLPNRIQYEL